MNRRDWWRLNNNPVISGGLTLAQHGGMGLVGTVVAAAIKYGSEDTGERIFRYVGNIHERGASGNMGRQFVTPQKRKRPREEPNQTPNKRKKISFDNLPNQEQGMPRGTGKFTKPGTGNVGATNDEVDVVPIPKQVSKIHNDYFTIQLPIAYHAYISGATNGGIGSVQVNLNTINTPFISFGATADYRGRNQWASVFQYYRVLRNDLKMTWYNANQAHFVGWHLHEDTMDANWTTQRDMLEAKHGGYDMIWPHSTMPYTSSATSGFVAS